MILILFFFFFLWLVRTIKDVLFWFYLWQIKEYHWARFTAHFKTAKGQELLLNKARIIKVFLLSLFLFNPLILFVFLPLIYLFESGKTIFDFYKKTFLKPVFTLKTIVLVLLVVFLEIFLIIFFFLKIEKTIWLSVLFFPGLLAIADLLTPIIVFLAVFFSKPATMLAIKKIMSRARKKRKKFGNLTVIGITGSYGKSSVKEFLGEILCEKFETLKTPQNINAEVGIARTILEKLNSKHQVFIAEIGAYNKGKIKKVCEMLKPDIGILTGINEQHLATFGSLENIKKAKYELIDSLPKKGIAVTGDNLEIIAENIKEGKEFIRFTAYAQDGDSADFKVNLAGKHNIKNILLAASCAKKLGMNLTQISSACLKIKLEQGGIKFLKKEGPVILDSSYSANPTGVLASLEYLKAYSGKKIVVMPCLIELGPASKRIHTKIGRKISEICDLAIITTKDYFKEIKNEASTAFFSENPKKICAKLKEFSGKEDVILLEGRISKKIKKEIFINFK